MTASRTIRVLGGQEAVVSLFEPPTDNPFGATAMSASVDGGEPRPIPVGSLHGGPSYGGSTGSQFAVLLSQGVPQDARHERPARGPIGTRGFGALLRSDVPVSQWSPNWLGYSCYDAILLTGQEVDQMPAPAQAAVRRYVECGGLLLVQGGKVPDVFSRGGVVRWPGRLPRGTGARCRQVRWGRAERRTRPMRWRPNAPGASIVPRPPADRYDLLVAEATVPVRGLFFLILLFSVAIGPVNVWLLSKFRRRIWLWWNVPVISLRLAWRCSATRCSPKDGPPAARSPA